MIIERTPEWRFKTAEFHILFDADPQSVLKYGPNGLHFTEHMLWNAINTKYRLMHTNASTYGTGEMSLFGICPEADLGAALESVYGALIGLSKGTMTPSLIARYVIEQKRLSAETTTSDEGSRIGGASHRMFVRNSDLIRSDFPPEYFWKILLEECKLYRLNITCHCNVPDLIVAQFQRLAASFETVWNSRRDADANHKNPVDLPIPKFFAPPVSWLNHHPTAIHRLINLDSVANPIEKMLISINYAEMPTSYCIKARMTDEAMREVRDDDKFDLSSFALLEYQYQYFGSTILVSSTPGMEIKSEWIDDIYSLDPSGIVKKYWKSAKDSLIRIITPIINK